MTHKVVAKLDKSGSESMKYTHYIFGKPGSEINGGLYIRKDVMIVPDFIEIEIAQVKGG